MNTHSLDELRLRDRFREETRNAILLSAESIFASRGSHGARMEDIAARAGVAVGTLYNYFGSRRVLLGALLDKRRLELVDRLDGSLADSAGAPLPERLRSFVRVVFEHFDAHRALFMLVIEEEISVTRGQTTKRAALSDLRKRAERLLADKDDRASAEDATLEAALLLGMLRGALIAQPAPDSAAEMSRLIDRIVDFFVRGSGRGP